MKFNQIQKGMKQHLSYSCFFALLACVGNASAETEETEKDIVVITGSKTEKYLSDTVVSMQVITRQDIEEAGGQTVADLLENESAFQITRTFAGTGLQIQGFGSKYILILVDGQRINGRVGGNVDLLRFPLERIERVEILKGPSSALYGSDALGGVINIITRGPRENYEVEAEISAGTTRVAGTAPSSPGDTPDMNPEWVVPGMSKYSLYAGWRNDSWSTNFTTSWHQVESYDLDLNDIGTSGSSFRTLDISQRTTYKLSETTQLSATADYQYRIREGIDASTTGAVYDRTNLIETFTAKTSARMKPSRTSQLQLSGSYSLFRDQFVLDQRNSAALDKDEETRDQLFQFNGQYDHLLFSKHLVSLGTEAAYEQLVADRIVGGKQDRYRMAVFIQDDWAVTNSPNIGFIPGVRFDFDSRFGTKFTPKAAMRYDPVDNLALKASYGAGFRAPDFKELALIFENPSRGYIVDGTPDLLPETSHGLNFSIEYSPNDVASLSASLFRNEITDLISFTLGESETTGIRRFRYINIASAMTRGGELNGRLRLWDAIKINLGYTYTDSNDAENNRPLEGRSRHRLSSRLVYDIAAWDSSLAINAVINGPAPYYVPTAEGLTAVYYPIRLDSAPFGSLTALNALIAGASEALIDIRFRTRVFENFTVFVNLNNILDSGEARFFAAPPLNVIGGLIAKL